MYHTTTGLEQRSRHDVDVPAGRRVLAAALVTAALPLAAVAAASYPDVAMGAALASVLGALAKRFGRVATGETGGFERERSSTSAD